VLSTLRFIYGHPLNRKRPIAGLVRFAAWQLRSRAHAEVIHPWVDGTKLAVRRGMTGATGNIYCGLHEFPDMAFVLHALRANDLFLDIGANVGSYTILASGVCAARTLAFEPASETVMHLRRNIEVNALEHLVEVHQIVLGRVSADATFTVGRDTLNRVALPGEELPLAILPMRRLDDVPYASEATLIKLDVEGYEAEVLAGASRVLAARSVLAVETEGHDEMVEQTLMAAGFVRRWYDPWSRSFFRSQPAELRSSNALYLRDEAAVLHRVRQARYRKLYGQKI
jgi:FkbM family methyltransferase